MREDANTILCGSGLSEERDKALAELTEKMKDEEYASLMLDIALNFDAAFDPEPLKQYLRRRKRERRQEPQDHIDNFYLSNILARRVTYSHTLTKRQTLSKRYSP